MKDNVVKSLRLKLCWEQDKLAKEIGASCGAVSNWERGTRLPRKSYVRKMAEIAQNHKIKFNMDDLIKKG